ncbi:hypothetical protein Q4485_17275 [Granulosicoccaceae sp. 1_MG-2023]|nr:hypothetical protein [Granulosicoccaceae sp. 1_MG-2023]
MKNFKEAVKKFISDEEGLTIIEYAVGGGALALAVAGVFDTFGKNVGTKLDGILNTTAE